MKVLVLGATGTVGRPVEKQVLQFLPPWMVFDFKMMYAHFQKHGLRATADELKTLETLLGHAPRSFDAFVGEMVAPRPL